MNDWDDMPDEIVRLYEARQRDDMKRGRSTLLFHSDPLGCHDDPMGCHGTENPNPEEGGSK